MSTEKKLNFLKTNFCCDKTLGRFLAIGIDHALEQVNKELKGLGGIRGMSDEEIDRFCLIAPTKRFLITQFAHEFQLRSGRARGRSSDIHHEETGNYKLFPHKGVKSYCTSLLEFINLQDILKTDCCYRIMSNTVLSNDREGESKG